MFFYRRNGIDSVLHFPVGFFHADRYFDLSGLRQVFLGQSRSVHCACRPQVSPTAICFCSVRTRDHPGQRESKASKRQVDSVFGNFGHLRQRRAICVFVTSVFLVNVFRFFTSDNGVLSHLGALVNLSHFLVCQGHVFQWYALQRTRRGVARFRRFSVPIVCNACDDFLSVLVQRVA